LIIIYLRLTYLSMLGESVFNTLCCKSIIYGAAVGSLLML